MHPCRREFLSGSAAVTLSAASGYAQQRRLFDSHCHVIDHRFPIVANRDIPRRTFRSKPISRRQSRLESWPVRSCRAHSRPMIRPI